MLDGDEVRTNLSKGLGFSREDRDTNILRIGYVAKFLSRNRVAVVVAAISAYVDAREQVRRSVERFVEVHVDCSLDELVRRDPKGLYRRALAGEIEHFTGVSDPYQEPPPVIPTRSPPRPEVHIDSERQTVEESLAAIVVHLERSDLIPAPAHV